MNEIVYEKLLEHNIKKLNMLNPIYTLSGGIDSSLIWSYLDNPDCFCVQVDGNEDWYYAKSLYPKVKMIEFNDVDIEKILTDIQSLWDEFYFMMGDMFDYFVYQQYENRLVIVGEEPKYDMNGNDRTEEWRKLFLYFRRMKKVDSPYHYHSSLYNKKYALKIAKKRLPNFISKRQKRNFEGPNPIWKKKHKDQIEYLKIKYNVVEEDFNVMWKKLNFEIWKKIH